MRLRSGLGISWSWSATTGHQVALTDKERFWEAQEEKAFVDFTS
jgi:plastocyanin